MAADRQTMPTGRCWRRSGPSPCPISGSRRWITIAPRDRDSRRSSSAWARRPSRLPPSPGRSSGRGHPLLVTRADHAAWQAVEARVPGAEYHELARAITLRREVPRGKGTIAIASAGTSDVPVAEEAAVTAELMGNDVERLYDVGVAGIHRVLRERARLETARVIVVVAGMEGALPSVVAGMVHVPVIAVPTSIGYGASFGGVAALLGMLNSCANGVSVVNIDNGFGAGCIASMINHL